MAANRMESYIKEMRAEFRKVLENNCKNIQEFIRKALEETAGEFDEQCLRENLKEELQMFQTEIDG